MEVKISIIKEYKNYTFPEDERIQGLEHSVANLVRGLELYTEDWVNSLKICSAELRMLLIDKNQKRQDSALLYEVLRKGGYRIFISLLQDKTKHMSLKDYMKNTCLVASSGVEWTPSTIVYEYANKWGGVHNDKQMSENYQKSCNERKIVELPESSNYIIMPMLSYHLCHTTYIAIQISAAIMRDLIDRGYEAQRLWDKEHLGRFSCTFSNIIPTFAKRISINEENRSEKK